MTTPSAQDAEHILATQQHRSRMKDDDPAYLRLRDTTQRRLSASLQRLVRELRGAHPTEQHTALSDFISRQTSILQDAYIAAHNAGASDYFGEVSQTPQVWAKRSAVDPDKLRRVMAFYAPSIAKMAHEALAAVNAAPGVNLEEVINESIKLGFFSGFSRVTSGMRGALGSVGNDPNHTLYSAHHQFAGRAKGEHNEANIHEHIAAQHHGDDVHGGGAGRRLARPNESAYRRTGGGHQGERSANIHEHLTAQRSEEGAGGGGNSEHGEAMTHPWQMTFQKFMDYHVPSPVGDHSRSPRDVQELRDEGGLLSDYAHDSYTMRDLLGHGYDPKYDMSRLLPAIRQGKAIEIFRSTDAEREIWPGAYVTPSRQYAVDHGVRNAGTMGGKPFHLLKAWAHPDELVGMNPNEFFYVPRNMREWYDAQVKAAMARGENVPQDVLDQYNATGAKDQ